ncbi:MAG: M81 family metallopeptidase, partial [Actinobacteria bacterium]
MNVDERRVDECEDRPREEDRHDEAAFAEVLEPTRRGRQPRRPSGRAFLEDELRSQIRRRHAGPIRCRLQVPSQEPLAARRRLRIGVGGISLESNDFVPFTAERTDFVDAGFLAEGNEIFGLIDSTAEIGGALQRLRRERDVEIVPLLAARGVSSGRLSTQIWTELR